MNPNHSTQHNKYNKYHSNKHTKHQKINIIPTTTTDDEMKTKETHNKHNNINNKFEYKHDEEKINHTINREGIHQIKEVWQHNLVEAMNEIENIIDKYPYVALVCFYCFNYILYPCTQIIN